MNKIHISISLLLCISFISKAQFNKGDIFLGASLNVSTQSRTYFAPTTNTTERSLQILPKIGVFINEKMALGGSIGYNSTLSEASYTSSNSISKTTYNSFSVGILARRYFTVSEKFFFAIDGTVDFERGVQNLYTPGPYGTSENKSYTITATLRPLLVFMPSTHWSLEGGIGNLSFSHFQSLTSDETTNGLNFNAGGITFAVAYYFRKN